MVPSKSNKVQGFRNPLISKGFFVGYPYGRRTAEADTVSAKCKKPKQFICLGFFLVSAAPAALGQHHSSAEASPQLTPQAAVARFLQSNVRQSAARHR